MARRQALINRLSALKNACTIAFDGNYRPGLWEDAQTARTVTAQMWALADIALPGLDDEMALFGDGSEEAVIARFEQRDFDACVIKCGARGPLSLSHKEALPAFPLAASVVDTTAAGDSFNGGYLAARLMGKTEAACLMTGHRLAVQVVGAPGAIVDTVNPRLSCPKRLPQLNEEGRRVVRLIQQLMHRLLDFKRTCHIFANKVSL